MKRVREIKEAILRMRDEGLRMAQKTIQKQELELLYEKYNHREFVHPDPLEFLYRYPDLKDRELVGMIGSALAYGRVTQILKSVSIVLDRMGPSPYEFIKNSTAVQIASIFNGFVHRFATGNELSRFLTGIKGVLDHHGSLYQAFLGLVRPDYETVLQPLSRFCKEIDAAAGGEIGHLLPMPERGSACKRMNLFLRWMVRRDAVDPGGWEEIPAAHLIVPLDIHMHRIGQRLGFTARKQTDIRTAMEITNGFKRLYPEDPVRYDFALTRLGIRREVCYEDFFS